MTSRHETRRAWISRDNCQAGIITIGSGAPSAARPAGLPPALAGVAAAGRDMAELAAAVVSAAPASRPSHWRRVGCGSGAAPEMEGFVFMVALVGTRNALRSDSDHHRLGLGVVVEHRPAHLAAEPR